MLKENTGKMKPISKLPRSLAFAFLHIWIFLFYLVDLSEAQPKTDPNEVSALDAILRRWRISPQPSNSTYQWYTTGDPCSGVALANNASIIDDEAFNAGIICDCNYDNGSTCHIIRLKVMEMGMDGEIPNELLNLTYLVYLKLDKNYLTGPLPAFLARLTKLKILAVAFNSLSGPIPEELGTLKDLIVLSLEYNNFSGALPSQLGNLINLQHFYISSTGLSGEIPSSFSKLSNMKIMWASDNKFVGKIPDFIGNWTLLEDLRFQGNSFEGPIPSSFSSLTNLNELRISELSNTSSTLDFIKNMKNLVTLVLRNNMISGTIPSNIVEYSNLKRLDLSFNNLTGRIPSSLFTLQNLNILFLGNNGLFGPLPAQMGPNLVYIDLSYNELSGSFPPWVTKPNIHVNLVGNNFTFGESNISNFKGLECLQRNFPCNRGTPRYAKIAINCGGETMKDTNGDEFDQENYNMSATSYFVTDNRKWAVSNAGIFFDKANLIYIHSTTSPIQVGNTSTGALFQQVRLSPGSLRYYGLSIENGMYIVSLYFAETGFDWVSKNKRIDFVAESWKRFGRRIFDIYIQGDLKIKDFEIEKEAGTMFKGIVKEFKANVTENYLEIHLFWAGKGTQRIPEDGSYGSSIAAIKFTPDFTPTVPGNPESPSSKRTGLIVFIVVVVTIVISTSVFAIFYMRRRKRKGIHKDEEILAITPRANIFSYVELRSATEDFNPKNKLGEGGFGAVYKGKLYDGRNVAVKQLSVVSPQGKDQFVTEIATISVVQHRNLVKLYGCCIEGDKRALVYEYLENKSLDKALFGKTHLYLDWPTRYEICLRTARGLAYLHEESNPRIIHRDVKASNILLDADLNPKISDFGLAKLYDEKNTHISTRVAGTIGYLAPEYAMRGHLTEKADVFGFGIVALEVLSGRPNADCSNLVTEKKYLLEWAWNLHEHHRELELMDQTLEEFDESEACRLIRVALLCTQASPTLRPSMSRVVAMLSGDIEVGEVTYRPGYLTDWQLNDIISSQASSSTFSTLMPSSTSSNPNLTMKGNSSPPTSVTQPMLHDSQREYVVLT
ncbi:PREDICTED: probable LRR receptor-like serine/threonine-protein kinase At1g56140 [Nelumbo nucifera]|uniref:non-specific serine/threonine protein kinase n=1 Tax=Nelumbo nucifera TaxID=4432 RepID=A0A1U7YTL9_NELNU|nr:PREDICTED: probable LRR receptor-like serine/threonine-protein kinase At1g56140 [Nelumbo nucifera]